MGYGESSSVRRNICQKDEQRQLHAKLSNGHNEPPKKSDDVEYPPKRRFLHPTSSAQAQFLQQEVSLWVRFRIDQVKIRCHQHVRHLDSVLKSDVNGYKWGGAKALFGVDRWLFGSNLNHQEYNPQNPSSTECVYDGKFGLAENTVCTENDIF